MGRGGTPSTLPASDPASPYNNAILPLCTTRSFADRLREHAPRRAAFCACLYAAGLPPRSPDIHILFLLLVCHNCWLAVFPQTGSCYHVHVTLPPRAPPPTRCPSHTWFWFRLSLLPAPHALPPSLLPLGITAYSGDVGYTCLTDAPPLYLPALPTPSRDATCLP